MTNAHFTVIGWIAFLAILYLISKTKTGYDAIYYGLVLIVVFLLLIHYQEVQRVFIGSPTA